MLVATRDPMHSPGTHDDAPRPRPTASHATRFVAAMQIFGSVMAIPVGLGTAYSLYRTNFSVDTTCQALRANIISMIDKKIDATARRMLVRHDVETFENTCGAVDPDAASAFKTLLAAEPPARPVAAPVKAEATKRVKTTDQERDWFVTSHFGRDPKDASNFDLILNAERFTKVEIATMIVAAYEQMREHAKSEVAPAMAV